MLTARLLLSGAFLMIPFLTGWSFFLRSVPKCCVSHVFFMRVLLVVLYLNDNVAGQRVLGHSSLQNCADLDTSNFWDKKLLEMICFFQQNDQRLGSKCNGLKGPGFGASLSVTKFPEIQCTLICRFRAFSSFSGK